MVEEAKRSVKVLETIVILVILLVIVQTFLEDFSVIAGWSSDLRRILLISSFSFDLFFTIEFLTRLYNGLARRRALYYLIHQRGWIDFLASIPLLILASGPPLLALLWGGTAFLGTAGILNMLKLIKAIRIARILRLLRILKIFRNIRYTESAMAQRHTAKIITVATTVLVFALFLYSGLSQWIDALGPKDPRGEERERIVTRLDRAPTEELFGVYLDDSVLLVKRDGLLYFSRYDRGYYGNLDVGDYTYLQVGATGAFFDLREDNARWEQAQSWQALFFFALVLLLIFSYLIFYSPHFAVTVTDPIHVMRRGFSEADYNLEAKILKNYEEDDIFKLAKLYNEKYLPMKDRNRASEESPSSVLQMDDLQDILT